MSRRMYALSDNLQDQASKTVDNIKKYLHSAGNDAYDSAYALRKQMKSQYPKLVHNLSDAASAHAAKLGGMASSRAAQLKDALAAAGHEAYSMTESLGKSTRKAGIYAVKLSAVYALFKLYSNRNSEVAEFTQKVKSHIHAKPVESSLIAVGIGYMLAKILR